MVSINRLSPVLAIAAGVVHAGLSPVLLIAGLKVNLVLIAVVLVAAIFGFIAGTTWAFVAGLTANLMSSEPLGSVPLVLLVVAALVALGAPTFRSLPIVYPLLAVAIGSTMYDLGTLLLRQLISGGAWQSVAPLIVMTAAAVNVGVAAVVLVTARLVIARRDRTASGRSRRWPT